MRRALDAGWERIGEGALAAVLAAVRRLEDEPALNAGLGACLNRDGYVELDAAVMKGTGLRVGAVAAVRDVLHPVDLALRILEDGRHVLLVADGASKFAREQGVETCHPSRFVTERQRRNLDRLLRGAESDTVGAVAVDAAGRTAVAVSTGGVTGKLPGRVGDSPLAGAGFYADDAAGAVCGTGQGEGFIRLVVAYRVAAELGRGRDPDTAIGEALELLERRTGATGGLVVVTPEGRVAAAHSTPYMAWASRSG